MLSFNILENKSKLFKMKTCKIYSYEKMVLNGHIYLYLIYFGWVTTPRKSQLPTKAFQTILYLSLLLRVFFNLSLTTAQA